MTVSFFPAKKLIAAEAIAHGESHKHAANLANVTPGTISDWMHDSDFRAKINEIAFDRLNQSQDKFRSSGMLAVNTMNDIMANSKSDKARFEAAKYILDTIQIAPAKEGGLWWIGATTAEELESKEHVEATRKRLKEIQEELKLPIF